MNDHLGRLMVLVLCA